GVGARETIDPHALPDVAQTGPPLANDAPAILVLSSGSLGHPKAVVHSLATLTAAATAACERVPFGLSDRWAATLPFHHVGGLSLLFRALVGGGSIAFGSSWRAALEGEG